MSIAGCRAAVVCALIGAAIWAAIAYTIWELVK